MWQEIISAISVSSPISTTANPPWRTIVVDNSLFDGPAVSPKWMLEDLIWYYATGCHAFSYRDNQVRVEVRYNGHNYKTARITPPRSIRARSLLSFTLFSCSVIVHVPFVEVPRPCAIVIEYSCHCFNGQILRILE